MSRPHSANTPEPDDAALHTVEMITAYTLRYGVLLCTAVVGVGLVLSFATGSGEGSALAGFVRHITEGELLTKDANPLACLAAQGAACLADPQVIAGLGLVMLIALPILRVALALVAFAAQKDRIYAVLSAIVLAVLLGGLWLGYEF